jgi:hypothetical protein
MVNRQNKGCRFGSSQAKDILLHANAEGAVCGQNHPKEEFSLRTKLYVTIQSIYLYHNMLSSESYD